MTIMLHLYYARRKGEDNDEEKKRRKKDNPLASTVVSNQIGRLGLHVSNPALVPQLLHSFFQLLCCPNVFIRSQIHCKSGNVRSRHRSAAQRAGRIIRADVRRLYGNARS